MNIDIQQNTNGAFFWRLIAENGEILAHSESYASKRNCLKTIKSVAKQLNFYYDPSTLNWTLDNDTVD